MNRTVMAILGMLALALLPAVTMAKSHDAGQGGKPGSSSGSGPAPSPAAYEHADEKAKFLRDTHDMGEHKGEDQPGGRDQAKDKDQAKGKDKAKSPEQGADKAKSKEKAKTQGKERVGKEQGKGTDKDKDKKGQTDAEQLLEHVRQQKEEKAK